MGRDLGRVITLKAHRNHSYRERWNYLLDGQFDPATDIEIDDQGFWQWTDSTLKAKPQMVTDVARYFAFRREDD